MMKMVLIISLLSLGYVSAQKLELNGEIRFPKEKIETGDIFDIELTLWPVSLITKNDKDFFKKLVLLDGLHVLEVFSADIDKNNTDYYNISLRVVAGKKFKRKEVYEVLTADHQVLLQSKNLQLTYLNLSLSQFLFDTLKKDLPTDEVDWAKSGIVILALFIFLGLILFGPRYIDARRTRKVLVQKYKKCLELLSSPQSRVDFELIYVTRNDFSEFILEKEKSWEDLKTLINIHQYKEDWDDGFTSELLEQTQHFKTYFQGVSP